MTTIKHDVHHQQLIKKIQYIYFQTLKFYSIKSNSIIQKLRKYQKISHRNYIKKHFWRENQVENLFLCKYSLKLKTFSWRCYLFLKNLFRKLIVIYLLFLLSHFCFIFSLSLLFFSLFYFIIYHICHFFLFIFSLFLSISLLSTFFHPKGWMLIRTHLYIIHKFVY